MKIENAYECDCCGQLFRHGDGYLDRPLGAEIKLSVDNYGRVTSPRWDLEQICAPCRSKLIEAVTAIAGEPTDAAQAAEPEEPQPAVVQPDDEPM